MLSSHFWLNAFDFWCLIIVIVICLDNMKLHKRVAALEIRTFGKMPEVIEEMEKNEGC